MEKKERSNGSPKRYSQVTNHANKRKRIIEAAKCLNSQRSVANISQLI